MEKLEKEPVDAVRNPVYRGIWQLGLQQKNPVELSEEPQFPGFADIEKYFYDKMEYPVDMLKANRGGYAVCQFTIDTMGMAKDAFTLDSSEPACEKEVKRLINTMSHWLPAYDKAGKRWNVCTLFMSRSVRNVIIPGRKYAKHGINRKNSCLSIMNRCRSFPAVVLPV